MLDSSFPVLMVPRLATSLRILELAWSATADAAPMKRPIEDALLDLNVLVFVVEKSLCVPNLNPVADGLKLRAAVLKADCINIVDKLGT